MNADSNFVPAMVVVVRHGERLDYAERDQRNRNWVQYAKDRPERGHAPWDPPLTDRGKEQAQRVGQHLCRRAQIAFIVNGEECAPCPVTAVYTSPLLRCRQTACEIRRGINLALSRPRPRLIPDEPPRARSGSSSVGGVSDMRIDRVVSSSTVAKVRVEDGLMESLNRNWYNSWALPGSDGTWGYRMPPHQYQRLRIPDDLHPAACLPVQSSILPRWKSAIDPSYSHELDGAYESISRIVSPYALHPPRFESRREQQKRMRETIELLAQPGRTIVAVSHGGPVVHLYESVSGQGWENHGAPSYCCFSVYRLTRRTNQEMNGSHMNDDSRMHVDDLEEWKYDWEALAVNQSI
jgi:broad specificity phosphatase PhoE